MSNRKLNPRILRFVFAQVSSFLMVLGVNLSFVLFADLFASVIKVLGLGLFRVNNVLRACVLLFMLGAILSTFNNIISDEWAFKNSLAVLPNYIYWSFIVLLFTALAPMRGLDFVKIFKFISLAVITSIVYYLVLQDLVSDNLFFKKFGPNNFSFLLICYSPYLIYFLRRRFNIAVAVFGLILILIQQLNEGRRAGFSLILISGILVIVVYWLKFNSFSRLFSFMILMLFGFGLLYTDLVESTIKGRSERVHQLIYEDKTDLMENDRSLLLRRAMVEKGLVLYNENRLFGIGLNNFNKRHERIEGLFTGAKFVVNKKIYERVSSHNSYINILAEGGLCLFIPFVGILLYLLVVGIYKFNRFKDFEKVIFFSFITMCVHLYFANAIVNSLAWFNISLFGYTILAPRLRLR